MKIPPVCSVVIPKEDYQKYLDWQKSGEKHCPFGLHTYRVTHHRKEIPLEKNHPLAKKCRARLKFSKPEEASWISGTGVCGILRHVSEVVMIKEKVEWPEEKIKKEQQNAVSSFWLELDSYNLPYVKHEGKLG